MQTYMNPQPEYSQWDDVFCPYPETDEEAVVIAFWRRVQRTVKSAMSALLANVESVFTSSREAESRKCAAVVSVDSAELEVAN